jgi:hypothetical protein
MENEWKEAGCVGCGKHPVVTTKNLCETCFRKSKRNELLRQRYAERPKCRQRINELLRKTPKLTLWHLAFWANYDFACYPLGTTVPSQGIRNQARKMLQEMIREVI